MDKVKITKKMEKHVNDEVDLINGYRVYYMDRLKNMYNNKLELTPEGLNVVGILCRYVDKVLPHLNVYDKKSIWDLKTLSTVVVQDYARYIHLKKVEEHKAGEKQNAKRKKRSCNVRGRLVS